MRLLQKNRKAKRGFTLVELIIAISIIGIVASVAVPSIYSFVSQGEQTGRMNIARTIYLAAQSELTSMRLNRSLSEIVPEGNKLDEELVRLSPEEEENRDAIRYVSTHDGATRAVVQRLLTEGLLDRGILNHAILLEINFSTGIVLSAFYSDIAAVTDPAGGFYYGEIVGEETNGNISGDRPYSNYGPPRRQGYFGVGMTGDLAPVLFPETANIFDGAGDAFSGLDGRVNVLYAEFILDRNAIEGNEYTFEIINADSAEPLLSKTIDNLGSAALTFDLAFAYDSANPLFGFYEYPFGDEIDLQYARYIWIIDYISGDLFTDVQEITIDGQLNADGIKLDPQMLRARVSRNGDRIATSLTSAHTHFGGQLPGSNNYEIRSARHLNNIRHLDADNNYTQTADIKMRDPDSPRPDDITNFVPIAFGSDGSEPFEGRYAAMRTVSSQFIIENLRIDTSGLPGAGIAVPANIGLFSEASGVIQGVALFNAEINVPNAPNGANIGAIAGELTSDQGRITQSWSYGDVTSAGTGTRTGGLVGLIGSGARVDQSFNAGFFDHQSNAPNGVPTSQGTGSVTASGGSVGGLAGRNEGSIISSFNNARVNISTVDLETTLYVSENPQTTTMTGTPPGGIAGYNTGTIARTYATNFTGTVGSAGGAIAGENAGSLSANYFIGNGADTTGQSRVSKEDLAENTAIVGALTGFVPGTVTYEPGLGKNTYEEHYPYPVLTNNNPFGAYFGAFGDAALTLWGWEDILGETGSLGIAYYELYDNNTWGYGTGSVFATPAAGLQLVPQNSIRTVRNDGYLIEFIDYSPGYTVAFGDTVIRIRDESDTGTPDWKVYAEEGGIETALDWIAARVVPPVASVEEQYYHLFIPNAYFENLWNTSNGSNTAAHTISVAMYLGAGTTLDENAAPITAQPILINPMFAPQDAPSPAETGRIRSPRHIQNIGANAATLNGSYTQQLSIDFGIYRKELTVSGANHIANPAATLDLTSGAATPGTFTGTYNGRSGDLRWIANLTIDAAAASDAGLFSVNGASGVIENILLINPRIRGDNNVGAIAGQNSGTIRAVTVQSNDEQNYLNPAAERASIAGASNVGGIAGLNNAGAVITRASVQQTTSQEPVNTPGTHPITIIGTTNVGGIAGTNNGTITDVSVVSTSARPAVRGTNYTAANVGGIVGNANAGTVNNLMYFAVAPRTGTTVNVAGLRPFAGTGTVGANTHYLSGQNAIRPFRTSVAPPETIGTYNRPATGTHPAHARTTLDLVREFRTTAGALTGTWNTTWASTWTINNLTEAAVVNQTNTTYPYPYPIGTVAPVNLDWPLTDSLTLNDSDTYVYYEKYADGTTGVFVRRLVNPNDMNAGYVDIDLLNPYGVIVEAGYASWINENRESGRLDFGFGFYVEATNDWTSWTSLRVEGRFAANALPGYDRLFPFPVFWFEEQLLGDANFAANPHMPIVIGIPSSNGNDSPLSGVALVNPLFAKSVYPITFTAGTGTGSMNRTRVNLPSADTILADKTFYIHTPWQMQQISRLTSAAKNGTAGRTFLQGNDISFSSATLSAATHLFPATNSNANALRTAGTVIPYTATTTQNNGTTAVFPTTGSTLYPVTGHVVRDEFLGTFDGGGRTISDLTLPNSAALPRSLFASIGSEEAPSNATVRNISIDNFDLSGSANISAIAALNYKNITDISITKSKLTGAPDGYVGGVAGRNFGEILRVDVTETVIENTGTG
ncbi:MAG: prepilin-type N-terminal cleavage/methylation domain-containing protein, partial [Oscillospiraceae bacterium]|nr:prepilin-type N-terminal cleavage/methylation domain-containing protein [Oscillospiraceae bacterium]